MIFFIISNKSKNLGLICKNIYVLDMYICVYSVHVLCIFLTLNFIGNFLFGSYFFMMNSFFFTLGRRLEEKEGNYTANLLENSRPPWATVFLLVAGSIYNIYIGNWINIIFNRYYIILINNNILNKILLRVILYTYYIYTII